MRTGGQSLVVEVERDLLDGKPLADLLRKCIILGTRSGSAELRDWASKELRGYDSDDELPTYRTVSAAIQMDAVTANTRITGQTLGENQLPDFVREEGIGNTVHLRSGIDQLASMASHGNVIALSLPGADLIAQYFDSRSGNPWQHIDRIYWSVSTTAIDGVLGLIRTVLTELIAELSASVSDTQMEPSTAQADNAVQVAVYGAKARVTLTNSLASGGSTSTIGGSTDGMDDEPSWWTFGRKVWTVVVGLFVVAGAIAAIIAVA
ncbi:hypothetical protein [Flexivirga caeni]|nr:hypothetical protein [Flexivirga caeni]